jgi:nucleoside-diphosphate-sugar epimerase
LPLVIVMPGVIYGPGDNGPLHEAFMEYLTHRLPLTPKGTAFSWGYVDDVAHAHILAMEKGKAGEEYIIAGPMHTFIDAMALAERITGIKAPRIHPGPSMMRAMAAVMGVIGAVLPLPASYTAESLRVSAGVTYIGDNSKARRELGYDPRPLEAGLPQALMYAMRLLGMKPPQV